MSPPHLPGTRGRCPRLPQGITELRQESPSGGKAGTSQKEVRYVVSRLKDPDDLESAREPTGWYPYLDLAKKHADRVGVGTCVDAEGETYDLDGPYRRRGRWQTEWTNRNLHQGAKKKIPAPEV